MKKFIDSDQNIDYLIENCSLEEEEIESDDSDLNYLLRDLRDSGGDVSEDENV